MAFSSKTSKACANASKLADLCAVFKPPALEAFSKMREIDKNCKVVIASGFSKDETLNELRRSGLAGFIQKPYKDYELSQLLVEVSANNANFFTVGN